MIKPFDVRDFLLVSNLQNQGVLLNLEEALTQTYRPLLAALVGCLPLQGLGVSTYVCDEVEEGRRMAGFAQVRLRRDSSEADVVYLAPSPSAAGDAKTIWCRLLENLCREAGEQGIHRIFARLPEDGPEVEAFQQVGFSIYTREDIFRLVQIPPDLPRPEKKTVRPQQPADGWGLQGLYAAIAPRLVQRAENLTAKKWEAVPGPWLKPARHEGCVLEEKGGIIGYLRIRQGQTGHWLEMLLHRRAYERADELVEQSLSLLAEYPPRPIYCCLRRYQGGLRVPLEAKGFQLFASQCVMIKYTTVRVRKPALKLVPALEKRAEAATPMMKTQGNVK
ncbi:MAG: hypothetical protein ACE5I2_07730 [Anaerolineae bacterium]